jgi:hypothetical protein
MTKVGKIFLWVIVLVAVVLVIYFLGRDVKDENVIDKTLPAYNYENEIIGKKEDLLSFTILPGTKVPNGILSYRGSIKGAWFFEGNILINILDSNKVAVLNSNAVATTDWMTAEAVDFEGNIDFTNLPSGNYYFEIHNDNASGEPEFDKFIQIPIVKE